MPSSGPSNGAVATEHLGCAWPTGCVEVRPDRDHQRVERDGSVERSAGCREHDLADRRAPRGPRPQQARLADPRLTRHHDDLQRAGMRPAGDHVEPIKVTLPADQPGQRGGRCRVRPGDLAAQDRRVQRLGLRRRIRAEVVGQAAPRVGVGGQRRPDPPAADVGAHQQPQRVLVVRVILDRNRG